MTNSLCSAYMGNGLSIWRKGEENIIAHIDSDRKITYREAISFEEQEEIRELAKSDDREISTTQEQKVFKKRPYEL